MKTTILIFLQLLVMTRADEIIDLVIDGIYACNTIIFWDYYHGNLEAVKAHSLVLVSIISVAIFCLYIINKFVIDLYEFISEKKITNFCEICSFQIPTEKDVLFHTLEDTSTAEQ